MCFPAFFNLYIHSLLYKVYFKFFTFLAHIFGPDAGLYFSDVSFAKVEHTQAGLSDTSSDRQGKGVIHQSLVEIKFQSFSSFLLLTDVARLLCLHGFPSMIIRWSVAVHYPTIGGRRLVRAGRSVLW